MRFGEYSCPLDIIIWEGEEGMVQRALDFIVLDKSLQRKIYNDDFIVFNLNYLYPTLPAINCLAFLNSPCMLLPVRCPTEFPLTLEALPLYELSIARKTPSSVDKL